MINKLATELTKRIENDVLHLCIGLNGPLTAKENKDAYAQMKQSPNFFMIRETIFECLSKYIDVLEVTTKVDHEMILNHTKKQINEYLNYSIKKEAESVCKDFLSKDEYFEKYSYDNNVFGFSRSITKYIAVVKLGKLKGDVK